MVQPERLLGAYPSCTLGVLVVESLPDDEDSPPPPPPPPPQVARVREREPTRSIFLIRQDVFIIRVRLRADEKIRKSGAFLNG